MAEKTGISWADHTFNPWWGCTKVSPGCKNCYALTLASRYGFEVWGPGKPRREFGAGHYQEPLKWDAAARRDGVRRRVFCGSMMDWADEEAPAHALERVWSLVRLTPDLDWLMLTKRPERIAELLPEDWGAGYPNVWLGTSVESPAYYDRIEELMKLPAAVRFLSLEPLLEPLDIRWALWRLGSRGREPRPNRPDWLIVGGESGPNRRAMDIAWAVDLQHQAAAAGVAFWFKQIGAHRSGQGEDALGRVYHELPEVRG